METPKENMEPEYLEKLRDKFAEATLVALLPASLESFEHLSGPELTLIAEACYRMADYMMTARNNE